MAPLEHAAIAHRTPLMRQSTLDGHRAATLDGKKQRRAPPAAHPRGTERRTSKRRRALIIGGSMSGLLAALMLQRRGWDVDVFERVETELAGRGAGILAQAELIAHLGALGLEVCDLGVVLNARKMLDAAGEVMAAIERPHLPLPGCRLLSRCLIAAGASLSRRSKWTGA